MDYPSWARTSLSGIPAESNSALPHRESAGSDKKVCVPPFFCRGVVVLAEPEILLEHASIDSPQRGVGIVFTIGGPKFSNRFDYEPFLSREVLLTLGAHIHDRSPGLIASHGVPHSESLGTGVVEGSQRLSVPTALGVAATITPWNFPAVLVARKVGAALAAGCTVVLKGSEFTPYSATVIVKALVEAGLPKGVVNLVFGDPAAVSEQLLSAPAVKIVSFTGSTHVGKLLAAQAAKNLTRCVFELGGHAPVIVWEDADPERVIQITAPAKFGTAGQSCVAPTRFLVHESLHDQIIKGLVAKAESFKIGHGLEEGTTLGPVAHAGRIKEFNDLIEDAISKGAVIETGGRQVDRPGFFFKPTVLSNVPEDAKILFEEPRH